MPAPTMAEPSLQTAAPRVWELTDKEAAVMEKSLVSTQPEESTAETVTTFGGVPEDEAVNTVASDIFASSVADTVQSEAPATEGTETEAEVPADKDARTDAKEEAGGQRPKSSVYITMSPNLARTLWTMKRNDELLQQLSMFRNFISRRALSSTPSASTSHGRKSGPTCTSAFPTQSRLGLADLRPGQTIVLLRGPA